MATFRANTFGSATDGSDPTRSISAVVGDLLVVVVNASGNTNTTPTFTDDRGGTYTRIRHAFLNASADSMSMHVRDSLITTAQLVTITSSIGTNTAWAMHDIAISGMALSGAGAIRQSARQVNQTAATIPAPAFASSALTTNLCIGSVANGSNPANLSAPSSFTERLDTGEATPNTGLETVTIDSGFTGTTVTWGNASATAFASIIAELDASGTTGTAAITLGALTVAGVGNVPVSGSADIALGAVTLSAAGNVPVVGSLTKTLGALTILGTGIVSDPTATTAIALGPADSGQTQLLAGMTYVQFDGADSYAATASPSDGTFRIAEWNWDFDFLGNPGVYTASGMHVAHKYDVAGTYRVKLTVVADDGSTASDTVDVTIAAAPAFGSFHKYIRSDGDDGVGHSGNANTSADAYKTYQRFADKWRDASPTTTWGLGEINGNDTVTYDHSQDPDYGPLSVRKTGAGVDPIISCTNTGGAGFRIAASGHNNDADHPVFFSDTDLTFPTPGDDGGWNLVEFGHVWCQFVDGQVTKAGVLTNDSTGGGAPDGACLVNVSQSQSWRNGLFISSTWNYIKSCTFTNNGSQSDRDNGIYISDGADRFAIEDVTIVRGTPPGGADVTTAGLNHSGAQRGWCHNLVTDNVLTAWGPGGNALPPGEETLDLVCSSLLAKDTILTALYPDYCQRISVRNPRVIRGCGGGAIVVQEASATQFVQGFRVSNGSFALIDGPFCFFNADTHSTGILIRNCAVTKPAGLTGDQKYFYTLPDAANVTALTADYNVYWRVGGTPDADTFFASVLGVDKTWAQWQALGFDAHSVFQDPLFNDPASNDLTLDADSPCIGAGISIGVISKDCVGTPRTGLYTIGAFHVDAGSPPPDTTPPTVEITAPINGSTVSGTIAVSASASDDTGVVGVQFKKNGVNLGIEDTTAPYSINWDTTSVPDGTYSLTAVARDAAGNSATSAAVTVFVVNATGGGGGGGDTGATLPATHPLRGPLWLLGTGPFRPYIGTRARLFPTIPHRRK